MFEAGSELKQLLGAENVYDLSLGNPVIEPPAEFFSALQELSQTTQKGLHRYMPNAGFDDVRETIAKDLNNKQLLTTTKKHITMCVGAGGGLNVILKALLNQGDEVIVLAPYFVEYLFYIKNNGGQAVTVNTDCSFDLDISAIAEALNKKTRAILICSPNNPTGTIYSKEKIASLHDLLHQHNKKIDQPIMLISDEPYRELYYGTDPLPSTVYNYPHSAIVYSWSKSLSIPGERIGYIALSENVGDERLSEAIIFCTRILGFVNAPATMQLIVKNLISCTAPVEHYRKLRDKLYKGLEQLGFECIQPMGAFYVFPKIPDNYTDDIAFVTAAQQQAVLLVPGSGFGWPGNFRISYAVDEWVVDGALKKMSLLL